MPEVTNPNLIKILNAKAQPVQDTSGGEVFVPAPGAAARENRDRRAGELDEIKTGVTLEGGARAQREEVRGAARELRDAFEGQKVVQSYQIALPAYTTMLKIAADKPSKAGDNLLITYFSKVKDPTTGVLGGEFDQSKNVQTLAERYKTDLQGLYDPEAGFVSPEARRQFIAATHKLMSSQRDGYDAMRRRYQDIAQRPEYGVDPAIVVGADFGDGFREEIQQTWGKIFPDTENKATAPTLKVATGKTFSTDQDIANARILNELWASGASIEDMNKKSIELTTSPLSPEALDYLQKNIANRNLPAVSAASSGRQDAPADGLLGDVRDAGVGLLGGAVRGYSANMAEELVNVIDPDTAQKLQAALEYGADKAPVSNFIGETVSGVVSPLSKVGARVPGVSNPVLREALSGTVYGTLYGAGEADPNASLSDRAVSAAIGGTTGLLGGALGGKLASRGDNVAAAADDALPPVADDLGIPGAPGPVPTPPASDMEAVVDLARKATARAPGRTAARRELARMAKVNPAAQEAADRLGITLPPDVLSDNAQLLSLTGLSRSQVGSEAQNAWGRAVEDAIQRSDAVMDELGATTDLAQLSDDVSNRLNATMEGLKTQATSLRDEVTASFKPSDKIDASQTRAALLKVVDDLGGPAKAKTALSEEEKKLLAMLTGKSDGLQTYALIDRVRRGIAKGLYEKAGPWADADTTALKTYERALAEDQLGYIEQVGGKELADKQRAANSLFADMYAKREELQTLFGKDLSKSVVPLIRRAITSGSKGDAEAIRKVVANVPEEMRGKVLMSGLLAESSGKGAGNGGFSFANFVKSYRGIRANAPVYKEFVKYIGDTGDQTLIDLYAISRRMVEAENKVLKTGKANQAMIGQMNAENLLTKVAQSAGGRAVGTVATGAVAGPLVAGGTALASELATRAGGKTRMDKLHKLMSSDEFRGLMEKLAVGDAPDSAVNRVAASKPFVDFAKRLPIPQTFKSRAEWIKSAFAQSGGNLSTEPEPAQ